MKIKLTLSSVLLSVLLTSCATAISVESKSEANASNPYCTAVCVLERQKLLSTKTGSRVYKSNAALAGALIGAILGSQLKKDDRGKGIAIGVFAGGVAGFAVSSVITNLSKKKSPLTESEIIELSNAVEEGAEVEAFYVREASQAANSLIKYHNENLEKANELALLGQSEANGASVQIASLLNEETELLQSIVKRARYKFPSYSIAAERLRSESNGIIQDAEAAEAANLALRQLDDILKRGSDAVEEHKTLLAMLKIKFPSVLIDPEDDGSADTDLSDTQDPGPGMLQKHDRLSDI